MVARAGAADVAHAVAVCVLTAGGASAAAVAKPVRRFILRNRRIRMCERADAANVTYAVAVCIGTAGGTLTANIAQPVRRGVPDTQEGILQRRHFQGDISMQGAAEIQAGDFRDAVQVILRGSGRHDDMDIFPVIDGFMGEGGCPGVQDKERGQQDGKHSNFFHQA